MVTAQDEGGGTLRQRVRSAPLQRQQLMGLLDSSPAAIVMVDSQGLVQEWNPAAVALLGWSREEIVGTPLRRLVSEEALPAWEELWEHLLSGGSRPRHEDVHLHRNGSRIPLVAHLATLKGPDDRFAGVVCTLSSPDTSPSTAPLARDSGHFRDDVTGLPGRRWLQRRLAEPLGPGQRRGVAVLDIDSFALLNQDYGPDTADGVLRELGLRLAAVPGLGTVGRWQADEFVYVVDSEDPVADLGDLAAALSRVTRGSFRAGGDSVQLTVSAGLASGGTESVERLFRAAAAALHAAKKVGRDTVLWYDHDQHQPLTGGLRLAHDLSRGIADGHMRLHYQPIVELATNDATGVEALVRWQRPGVGLLSPSSFIDIAERTGQIVALGRWVTHQACTAAVDLAALSARPITVSINVSARQLSDPDLVPMLAEALVATGCPPTSISVEVTETAVLSDLRAATAVLDDIKQLGVGLDLDDFGTGYSSLLYLKHFPVDRIKIDQSFVSGLGTDAADTAIVASTIALAHSVGLRAVAEGVETPGQLALLRQMGCDFAQGYLLSRPMPFAQLCDWISQDIPSRLQPRATPGADAIGGRDLVADRRDEVGDQRDNAADRRDQVGDQRDVVGRQRDQTGDQRDRAADEREQLADRRELAADRRDVQAAERDRDSTSAAGTPEGRAALADAGAARQRAAAGRSQADHERHAEAAQRDVAEVGRSVAQVRRGVGASERRHAGRNRQRALAGRESAAQVPDAASVDALTGGYLRTPGLAALAALIDRAATSAPRMIVACVDVEDLQAVQDRQGHTGGDSVLVGVANAVAASLRPADLLIRQGPARLVCAFPGLGRRTVLKRLRVAQAGLAGPPRVGTVSLRVVELQRGESADQVVDRVAAASPVR